MGVPGTAEGSMRARSVVVMGGGVAGLAAAVLMAREGHLVTLIERDGLQSGAEAETAPAWPRVGIPHFLQPHAFIPRGRSELRRHLPDVYAALLGVGAWEVDIRPKVGGDATDADEELQYLAVRRPLIEWALRKAAVAEPRLTMCGDARVNGLRVDARRVVGVRVGDAAVDADLVVDALGRRTPTHGWLAAQGIDSEPPTSSDCGVVYYSRYYRCRPGFSPPDGPWFLSPRGDLGYLAYASFPGDNGTFAALLAVPTGVPEWKVLRDAVAFETAVAQVPALASWANPDGVDPITPIMAMAGLRNSLRAGAVAPGLVAVGDAYGHTDPVLAHGLAFGLVHAAELARVVGETADVVEAMDAYDAGTAPAMRERYEYATALDQQRLRMWLGEEVDFAHHDGDYALFTIVAGGVAATTDAGLARIFLRRIGLLDSTRVLDDDLALQVRFEAAFEEAVKVPRPRPGPTRSEMIATVSSRRG
jgi:2-polyprenyl-6-methoxyphenol hydroxylase-like FAD-dependent oxidoreductase